MSNIHQKNVKDIIDFKASRIIQELGMENQISEKELLRIKLDVAIGFIAELAGGKK